MPGRRTFALILFTLIAFVPAHVSAQEATPVVTGADLGLPELTVTIADDGWDLPVEIAAGRYLLTASYTGDDKFGTVAFVRLPEGWSLDDLQTALKAANTEEGILNPESVASPTASDGTGVDPTGGEESLTWLYRLTFAGGLSVLSGDTSQGVIDLPARELGDLGGQLQQKRPSIDRFRRNAD